MTVRTWYDTGAFGSNLLYGRVVAAGERSFVVEWESGIRNRLPQGYRGIEVVYGPERPS
ncbi:MAG TPA: hypothetical protein VD948_03630 [Rhodothermales bacterium]|nr:hypothetical protein [Rhodothermales bacterium]